MGASIERKIVSRVSGVANDDDDVVVVAVSDFMIEQQGIWQDINDVLLLSLFVSELSVDDNIRENPDGMNLMVSILI